MKKINVLLTIGALLLATNMWAAHSGTHYSKATAVTTGNGKAYVSSEYAYQKAATWSGTNAGDQSTLIVNCGGNDNHNKVAVTFSAQPNTGYHFVGWDKTQNATTYAKATVNFDEQIAIDDNNNCKSEDKATEKAKYYAYFAANTYSVAFEANTGEGSMDNMSFTYDAAQTLVVSAFTKSYTVTYDVDGGAPAQEAAICSLPFAGWATSADGQVVYSDEQSVSNLTTENNATVSLYAVWGTPSTILPTVTKDGFVLDGWYDGETRVGVAGDTYSPSADVTLKANWVTIYDFTVEGTDHTLEIGDVLSDAFNFVHADQPVAHISDESVISFEDNTLTALGVGTATIYFTQSATDIIKAGTSDTYTITVTKRANPITITMNDQLVNAVTLLRDEQTTVSWTSASESEFVITPAESNNGVVTFEGNTFSANYQLGETSFTVSQAENDTYFAGEATFTITVVNGEEDNTGCYTLEHNEEISLETTITSFTGVQSEALPINGTPDKLTFEAKGSGTNNCYVQYSTNGGSDWADLCNPQYGSEYIGFGPYDVPENATHIRINAKTGSTFSRTFRNIKITRKIDIKAADVAVSEPVLLDEQGSATLAINWSCVSGGDLHILCDNDAFALSENLISNTDCNSGLAQIPFTFTPTKLGEDVANIVIYNKTQITTCQLSATAINYTYGEYAAAFCEGDSIEFEGIYYKEAAVVENIVLAEKNHLGGDSIVTLTVSVNPTFSFEDEAIEIEEGTDTLWHGILLAELEVGEHVLYDSLKVAETGCDSVWSVAVTVVAKEPVGPTTAIDETMVAPAATKFFRNGCLYIRRGEALYDMNARKVK